MDRFIGKKEKERKEKNLKSSMDRFIVNLLDLETLRGVYLKSSMDRFIGGKSVSFK